jgi:hypothetical protein
MRQPLIASGVLHVAVVALLVLGLPPSDRKLDIPASIPIEIVDIGEITEAARVEKGEPKPEPPKPPMPEAKPTPPAPPPPEPVAETPPPPPPPKAPEPPKVAQLPPPPREPEPPKREPPPPPPPPPDPTPQPVPKPPPPRPEPPKPEPPKPEPPKPEPPKPEPPKPEPPKPQPPKPQPPKPEPAKPQPPEKPPEKVDPLANLLKDVAKLKPTDQKSNAKPQPSTQTASAQAAPTGPKSIAGPEKAFKPSGRAIDAIRGQVSKNWNFDPGRKDSGSMVVMLRIDVALDGTVIKADFEPETRARMGSDTHFRSAAEAALRAVLRTQKLDLLTGEFTPDTYDKWRTIVFTFDPRDMF